MNRVLKFRGWDGQHMLTPHYIDEFGGWYIQDRDVEDGRPCKGPLMQWTGLKDRNGKDIYEGDLLNLGILGGKANFPFDGPAKERIVKVIWSTFRHSWTCWFSDYANNDLFHYTQYGSLPEIVGNIYSNPDLLATKPETKD